MFFVSLLTPSSLARIAASAALVAALGLAGCGRKAPLDPPPASLADPALAPGAAPEPQEIGPDGRPVAPRQGPKHWTPLDWLID
jgi:predicted small lipoprotein YifL